MKITEVRVKLRRNAKDKLRAYASITIEESIVIRDLKIIEGPKGYFVAMPSRKLCDKCQSCAGKNQLRARFCNDCGARLDAKRGQVDERGRPRLYADIAHPINQAARDLVQGRVLQAYRDEIEESKRVGYVAQVFDDLDYDYLDDENHAAELD